MVNMGELFANPRIGNIPMDRVPLSQAEADRALLKTGDLLFARQSLVLEGAGKCSIFLGDEEPVTFESHVTRVRLNQDEADPRFYFYWLQSFDGRNAIRSIVEQGAGAAGIRGSDLQNLSVVWCPVETQREIADILGTLDDKIELNRRMNETLEAMARAIFQSWFVDFDPVHAKASGEPANAICQRLGLTPELLALFPDSFEDSELGDVPTGWQVCALDQVASYLNGLALQKYPAEDAAPWLPVIKIAQLRAGHTLGADKASISVPEPYVIKDGDVLFSWSGSLEVDLWCGGLGALNQHLFKVTSEKYPKWFYLLWTKFHLNAFRDIAANKATTMGHIQRKHLTEAKVLCPTSELLDAMTTVMTPLIEMLVSNRLESAKLTLVRDTLLPGLLSGSVSVAGEEGAS